MVKKLKTLKNIYKYENEVSIWWKREKDKVETGDKERQWVHVLDENFISESDMSILSFPINKNSLSLPPPLHKLPLKSPWN